jgi:poly-gamma-glutamate capsule biosynthesis protein CapA/YwtB (metallophosphatase superfamily)
VRGTPTARRALGTALVLVGALLSGCSLEDAPADAPAAAETRADIETESATPSATPSDRGPRKPSAPPDRPARGTVTLGFAGDVHFEYHLRGYLDGGRRPFGPITDSLETPDLMMVNLETALTNRGAPEPKQFTFSAPPRALDTLRDAGVDLVSLGNNHAADYGAVGVRDTLAAVRRSGVPAVGFGEDLESALTPFRTEIRGTDIAVFGINDRKEETAANWSAGPDSPGVVSHRHIPLLAAAVREAGRTADVVVVYAHWGDELATCPTPKQIRLRATLERAGVDVLVGSHAHVLQGSGWRGDTYVNFGLGNFIWYHDHQPATGILTLTVRDGEVVRGGFTPAVIQADGMTVPLHGARRSAALAGWNALRGCTALTAERPGG